MGAPFISNYTLPPVAAAATVSPEGRLAYVLQHFRLAYENVPNVSIGYAPAQVAVEVMEQAGDFFQQSLPYPEPPTQRLWKEQLLPFFFDLAPDAPLLELTAGHATINADLISGAFYLLSGWQEYHSDERDRHGRFPYAASVQRRYGFVTQPVVNHYFDVLKTAVEHVTGCRLRTRRWAGAAFAGFITHDVDNLRGGWGTHLRHQARQGQMLQAAALVVRKLAGQAGPWDNLEQVQAETARYGAASTFFILGRKEPGANGTPNADYRADSPALRARLGQLVAQGAEIGSHGSYGTAQDADRLLAETALLQPLGGGGNRFHYLGWEPRQTPGVLARAGVQYDSTLGFAEHFGFRNSYCLPFFPFDFSRGQAHTFLEIPLNVMDTTLHHPHYLQLAPEDILPSLQPMLREIERFGGVATVLWHNENFDPLNGVNGPVQFAEIMQYLRQQGAAFLTGSQIVAELRR